MKKAPYNMLYMLQEQEYSIPAEYQEKLETILIFVEVGIIIMLGHNIVHMSWYFHCAGLERGGKYHPEQGGQDMVR